MSAHRSAYGDALYSASLWPLNLIRDFPRRAGRLTGTIVTMPGGGNGPIGAWLHALAWYLFDLLGGPEFAQFFLRLATDTRRLTPDEIDAVAAVLGPNAIRYGDIRVAQRGVLDHVFRLNNDRAFATWHTINLPESRRSSLPLLVHELTHTYQYERVGSIYIGQGLWAQHQFGRKAYDYGGPRGLAASRSAGKRYSEYNREQQGQIAQDFCTLMRAGRDTGVYEPFIAELRAGDL
jgi:hypothetical protein